MNIKKILQGTIVAGSMLLSMTTMAASLKIATDSGAKGSPAGNAIEYWAELINKESNGDLHVDVFYQNQLGGQQEVFDLLVAGEVDLMLNWPMTSYDKRLSVLYTPYMFFNWDEALTAYGQGGWANNMLNGIYNDQGLKFLGAWPEGFVGVATRGSYAKNIAEAENLKVRTPPSFPFPQTLQALGYQATAIDWGEVFTSIQTGVVDGDAGNVIYFDYEYFRDVLDYYVRTKHLFSTGALTMNSESFEKLTDEQQEIVRSSAQKVMEKQFQDGKAFDALYVQKSKESGMEYIEPPESTIHDYATVVREKVWPLMEEAVGKEIMDTIKENATAL
ncbi:TRAP transporter substrate-binding protein DctP [Amphritea opalescens]|nr:TRAP transporter substrate-binding protein DctP [Amphritea opalescens]